MHYTEATITSASTYAYPDNAREACRIIAGALPADKDRTWVIVSEALTGNDKGSWKCEQRWVLDPSEPLR